MEHDGSDEGEPTNHATMKFQIRDIEENQNTVMEATTNSEKTISWKDRLLGTRLYPNVETTNARGSEEEDDFELSEGDVERSIINDIPSIKFSERINQILIKHVEYTIVINCWGEILDILPYNAL
ncbi:hypothetical protein GOBAR_AA02785 [Gossypium barbadense]|uniref:Uncharacterized protein n=1 Tax=Gossypium barbadense TaxID=3634 RepID=A0A2P5YQC4_GOSBA|nr:hypothetical protein GOBAR_AA02785 [Gossypium barbadense]